jgi:predicted ester cyclase
MTEPAQNKIVVERFDALVSGGDLDPLDELCTPDMVNHALAPSRPVGLAGTREFLAGAARFRSDGWQRLVVIAENDFVVQHGVRGGAWPGGPFLGIDAAPAPYAREVAFVYRLAGLAGGRIAERWAVRDDLGMLRQLGAFPAACG